MLSLQSGSGKAMAMLMDDGGAWFGRMFQKIIVQALATR
jgi:hypothetical protein